MNIEKMHHNVFVNVAIDEIMKKRLIDESKAVEVLNSMFKEINIFSNECVRPDGALSIRYAIMNKINKI